MAELDELRTDIRILREDVKKLLSQVGGIRGEIKVVSALFGVLGSIAVSLLEVFKDVIQFR